MLSIGNVVEYILKPVNEDQIVEAVIKCIIKIDEERKISELNRTLKVPVKLSANANFLI